MRNIAMMSQVNSERLCLSIFVVLDFGLNRCAGYQRREAMNESTSVIEKRIHLSPKSAIRLQQLAQTKMLSEEQIIEKALSILFNLSEIFDEQAERRGWSFLSEDSLARVWDNEEDAVYDNWRELYGVNPLLETSAFHT